MKQLFFISFLLLFSAVSLKAQNISIQLGSTTIAVNQYFSISVVVEGEALKNYSEFPEIPGFIKQGTSSSSSYQIINGSTSSSNTLTQNYRPTKEGTFGLRPFNMSVNGHRVSSEGTTITVGPAKQQQRRRSSFWDPFDDVQNGQEKEYVEVEDNVFFAISSNKNEIYEGEGVTITGALYIPVAQRNLFASGSDLGQQIQNIKKNVIPTNSWEESFEIKELDGKQVTLDGMPFLKFKLFQSVFYPLNDQDITIKPQKLKMIKYKIAKQRSFFGSNAQESFKTFTSKPKKIKVKPLPPHPLKDQVSVGDYELVEKVDKMKLGTDEGLKYSCKIYGEGNISAITNPKIRLNDSLNFFQPNIQTQINRGDGRVVGSKQFEYDVIPNEPGKYKLDNYVSFIYFNPVSEKYDTLKAAIPLVVSGESRKNASIADSDLGPFYEGIEVEDNTLFSRYKESTLKLFANIFILVMLAIIGFVIIKK